MRVIGVAAAACALAFTAGASAQGIDGRIGRFYEDDGWTVYRLGVSRPLTGPLATTLHGDYLRRAGEAEGAFAGLGLDVTAFRGSGPYVVAGVGAGMGSPHSQSFSSVWTSWSAGVGYELAPAPFLRAGVEARWREISLDRREGLELAAGLSLNLGGGRKTPVASPTSSSAAPPTPSPPGDLLAPMTPTAVTPDPSTSRPAGAATRLADSVIATATEAMGRPYKYGGTGTGGGGFDCSGLIQYAYGRHGIALPRRSVEQAREGTKVRKEVAKLLPGDLLTFSNSGGSVTHVGLYIGDRRFIHSATRGVQVSTLSAEDPYGRWWHRRWVGARRIVE
ncbi:MAG: C40 family peptidase [Gemmatimonadales bacterium]|nr:C40 family peptidase [Gemmatimonadales bacterium]